MLSEFFLSFTAQAQESSSRALVDSIARTPLSEVLMIVVIMTVIRVAIAPFLKNTPVHKRTGMYGLGRFVNEALDALVYAGVFVFMIIRPFAVQAFVIPSGSMWPTLYVDDYIVANKAVYRFSNPKPGEIVVFRPPAIAVTPENIDEKGEVKVDYIKRCIGAPGDLIELKEGILYRNGQEVEEPYRTYSECVDNSRSNCKDFRKLDESIVSQLTMANFKLVKRNGEIMPFNWTSMDGNSSAPQARSFAEGAPYVVASKFVLDNPDEAKELEKAPAEKVPAGYYLMFGDNRNGSFDGRAWGLVPRESIVGRSEAIWFPFSRWNVTH